MISIITAERPLSCLPSFIGRAKHDISISEVCNIMRESPSCLRMVARVRITSVVEHHTVLRDRNGRITDCVVVKMALVSDLSHSEKRRSAENTLTDSVHGKSQLVEPYQRHLATCIIRSLLPHHHDRSSLLFHCMRRNLLHPSVTCTVPSFQTWSE